MNAFPSLGNNTGANNNNNNNNNNMDYKNVFTTQQNSKSNVSHKPTSTNVFSDLPQGWVVLKSNTNQQSVYSPPLVHKNKSDVHEIWRWLGVMQSDRDMQNELLGNMSLHIDDWNLLGPPGESDDDESDQEYDNEDEIHSDHEI